MARLKPCPSYKAVFRSELEVDEVAVAEEAEEDDGVEACVVGEGTNGWPGPDSWRA